jgi:hypothetical protein
VGWSFERAIAGGAASDSGSAARAIAAIATAEINAAQSHAGIARAELADAIDLQRKDARTTAIGSAIGASAFALLAWRINVPRI